MEENELQALPRSHAPEIVKVLLQQAPHLVRFLISNNLVSNYAIRRVLQCHGYI